MKRLNDDQRGPRDFDGPGKFGTSGELGGPDTPVVPGNPGQSEESIALNPGDLAAFYERVSEMSGRDRTLDLSTIRIGEDLLDDPVAALRFEGVAPGELILVCDGTEILRDRKAVKPMVVAALEAAGIDCAVVTLAASEGHELHTTPDQIASTSGRMCPWWCWARARSPTLPSTPCTSSNRRQAIGSV